MRFPFFFFFWGLIATSSIFPSKQFSTGPLRPFHFLIPAKGSFISSETTNFQITTFKKKYFRFNFFKQHILKNLKSKLYETGTKVLFLPGLLR
jgi:hypothetical protein